MTDHDAVLRVFDARDRLGRKIPGRRWADGRPTMHPDEHEEVKRLTEEAEENIDLTDLEHGTVLARIWMNDRAVDNVEWDVDS